jgi:isopentenyl-diphosphate Delta-isomerase
MSDLEQRKTDHLDLAISGDVGFRRTSLLEHVQLLHCSLPELSLDEIDLSTSIAGVRCRSPLMIASMTGGNTRAGQVNLLLAEVAEKGGYPMGLGSQRAMVKEDKIDAAIGKSYRLRDVAPSAPIFANLGVVQAAQMPTKVVQELVNFVDASGLFLHMNPAQEMIQPGGDRDFRGCLNGIARLARELSVPVIVKETGNGISAPVAARLAEVGVLHVDVSGAGGTSWVGVETRRASGDKQKSGELFWDWGIPTAAALLQISSCGFQTIIASGGIYNGLDVARALALGAHGAAIARPLLKALDDGGVEGALSFLRLVEDDLRTAMLLTGSKTLSDLRRAPRVISPELKAWGEV